MYGQSYGKSFFKVILIGNSCVGKTAILERFTCDRFGGEYRSTIGADFLTKVVQLENHPEPITLQIWDTAGQERFVSMCVAFYRGADAVIVVYDITSVDTIKAIETWKQVFFKQCAMSTEERENFPVFIFGNKLDLVDTSDANVGLAKEMCDNNCTGHFLVSAKNGDNIETSFQVITKHIFTSQEKLQGDVKQFFNNTRTPIGPPTPSTKASGSGCC
eukprot:TRINITY_DN5729_c0_g1_i1.p1 TRINITY_DN5729_c0_g1~~TRINITY_DN5729_c0_g1_i1.p1  ORF type:complete len:240 (-),score=49.83 TRINITY_DN5729_c0_g1_i1:355-1005(-)